MRMVRPHFALSELWSHDDHSFVQNDPALDLLEALRLRVGPLVVVSGYRSPAHNMAVHGAAHSLHVQGRAFDLAWGSYGRFELLSEALAVGFTGIGLYSTWLHLDNGAPRVWWH